MKSQTGENQKLEGKIYVEPQTFVSGEKGIVTYSPKAEDSLICLLGSNLPGKGDEYWKLETPQCQKSKDEVSWIVKAPVVEHNTDYEFIVREYRNETSSSLVKLFVVSEEEKLIETEKKSSIIYEQGDVPIRIELSSEYYVEKKGKTKAHFIVSFERNTGYVFDYNLFKYSNRPLKISDENINRVFFSVKSPKNVNINCDAEKKDGLYVADFFENVATVSCDIEINENVVSYKIYPIEIKGYYGFYSDEKTHVTVRTEY